VTAETSVDDAGVEEVFDILDSLSTDVWAASWLGELEKSVWWLIVYGPNDPPALGFCYASFDKVAEEVRRLLELTVARGWWPIIEPDPPSVTAIEKVAIDCLPHSDAVKSAIARGTGWWEPGYPTAYQGGPMGCAERSPGPLPTSWPQKASAANSFPAGTQRGMPELTITSVAPPAVRSDYEREPITLAEAFEQVADGETIIAACVGAPRRRRTEPLSSEESLFTQWNTPVPWEEARAVLQHHFETHQDTQQLYRLPAVCVWTTDHLICLVSYDGMVSLQALPRNPVAGTPAMVISE
jgi:hypothetical protein